MALKHSYSSIKDFQGCGRRFHQVRILKRFKSQDTDATRYGTEVHKAFELYLTEQRPLPEAFARYLQFVEPLSRFSGTLYCEHKLGIRADFTPCDFYADDVWLRGIPDFLTVDEETGVARVGDFKTGKSSRFADISQLELMAALVMQHFPTIHKVKGALLFVVVRDIIKADFTREDLPRILSKWAGDAAQVESALENGVWNARPSALCRFCPLTEDACEHR